MLETDTKSGRVVGNVLTDTVNLVEVVTLLGEGTGDLVDEGGGSKTTTTNKGTSLSADSNVVADRDHLDRVGRLAGGDIALTGKAELENVASVGLGDQENTVANGQMNAAQARGGEP